LEINLIKNPVLRRLFIIAGWFFIGLGILGIILPVLPTTVFFLLATYFFSRSSEKFYHSLLHNKYFGKYIRNYRKHRGMPVKAKFFAILMLNISLFYSALYVVDSMFFKAMLFSLAAGLTSLIISLKTVYGTTETE